jgi:hypothetical protein
MATEDLRYPIGQFQAPAPVTATQVAAWIDEIERLPAQLRATVARLTPAQLATPYRPGGWRVSQVVHHLADSHLNSLIRFKFALTEDRPTIKPYFEERWAELADSTDYPVPASLQFIAALHARWVHLLRRLGPAELKREFVHPDSGVIRLEVNIGIYAWHGRHHLAHITRLAEREGWVSAR